MAFRGRVAPPQHGTHAAPGDLAEQLIPPGRDRGQDRRRPRGGGLRSGIGRVPGRRGELPGRGLRRSQIANGHLRQPALVRGEVRVGDPLERRHDGRPWRDGVQAPARAAIVPPQESFGQAPDRVAVVLVQGASGQQVLGQWAVLVAAPALEGLDEPILVDEADPKRDQPEVQVPVDIGSGHVGFSRDRTIRGSFRF